MKIEPKKINVILGPSGCGKSTLLSIIAGLDTDFKGTIKGIDLEKISYVFQEDCLLEWKTLKENIGYALSGKVDREDFLDYAHRLGLSDYLNYLPDQLSGGLRQRVNLLRAFLYPASLILMDEPFKSLDIQSKGDAINLFLRIQRERELTVLLVTHNLEEAVQLGDFIHILSKKPTRVLHSITTPYDYLEEGQLEQERALFFSQLKGLLE